MTDRLTPVGLCGRAEAVLADVPVEIAHDDVFGDVASRRRAIAPAPEPLAPEPLAPVSLADMLELLLNLAGRAALGAPDEAAGRDMRRYLDEHVDVIA